MMIYYGSEKEKYALDPSVPSWRSTPRGIGTELRSENHVFIFSLSAALYRHSWMESIPPERPLTNL